MFKMKSFLTLTLIVFLTFSGSAGLLSAQDGEDPVTPPGRDGEDPVTTPADPEATSPEVSNSDPVSISLNNPLEGIGSIEGLVKTLLNVLIVLAVPIVVFFIILAGFKYVTARGEPAKLEEAKRSLVYAIIGGVIQYN